MRYSAPFIDGKPMPAEDVLMIRNPYNNEVVAEVSCGGTSSMEFALAAAERAFADCRKYPSHQRVTWLRNIAVAIKEHADELAVIIQEEAGKPIKLARAEVARTVQTFATAADELTHLDGVLLPFEAVEGGAGRIGLVKRFPLGPVLAISPFNFPLNLVAHKVAPAIAAGNTVVLKPASQTPGPAVRLAELCLAAGLPPGVLNVVPCSRTMADSMVPDDRFKALSFTGSAAVGWRLKSRAGKKKVTLELGGNAAVIIEPDVNVGAIIDRLATGAFAYAGQICISVQRIYVHNSRKQQLLDLLAARAAEPSLCGNPADPEVICGPMIDADNATRIEAWLQQAVAAGGKLLCGGERDGNLVTPAVLADVPEHLPIVAEEAFGPIVTVAGYDAFEEAIAKVNASKFGLQAGIFTNDIGKIFQAFERLEVGGVIHNDTPMFRLDPMPYGGVKDSGFGREGLRYAIEELSELKLLVLNPSV